MARTTLADLSARCDVLEDRIAVGRTDLERLVKEDEKLAEQLKSIRTDVTELQKELAVLRHRVDVSEKRTEEWSRRLWMLVPVFVAAILSSVTAIIIALVKK